MLKKCLIILFLISLVFSFPKTSLAQTSTTLAAPIYTSCEFKKYNNPNFFSIIWTYIVSLFSKPYDIEPNRPSIVIQQDMVDYSDVNSPKYKDKHSYAGSRFTANNTQDCLKGNIIKDVLNNQSSDDVIGYICLKSDGSNEETCNKKQISNLAQFLLQTNQNFICDETNQKINTPQDIVDKINLLFTTPIPSYELPCYKGVYDDFFITKSDETKNTLQIMRTPLSEKNQNSNDTVEEVQQKVNYSFTPQSQIDQGNVSLDYLRPENDK